MTTPATDAQCRWDSLLQLGFSQPERGGQYVASTLKAQTDSWRGECRWDFKLKPLFMGRSDSPTSLKIMSSVLLLCSRSGKPKHICWQHGRLHTSAHHGNPCTALEERIPFQTTALADEVAGHLTGPRDTNIRMDVSFVPDATCIPQPVGPGVAWPSASYYSEIRLVRLLLTSGRNPSEVIWEKYIESLRKGSPL